jgi:hypothetical protein
MKFLTEVSPQLILTGKRFCRQGASGWLVGAYVAGVVIDRVTKRLHSDEVISEIHNQDIYLFQPKPAGGYAHSTYIPSLEDKNADDWSEFNPADVSIADVLPQ